jgi:hypothetical protein
LIAVSISEISEGIGTAKNANERKRRQNRVTGKYDDVIIVKAPDNIRSAQCPSYLSATPRNQTKSFRACGHLT